MKKSATFLRFLVVVCIIVVGVLYLPPSKTTVTPEQKAALTTYIETINTLNAIRMNILQDYQNSVVGAEKVTDSYRYLEEEIVPLFTDYQEQAKQIQLTDAAIQDVHALYLEATAKQSDSFRLYVDAYRNQKEDAFLQANTYLEESNAHYQLFDKKLRTVAKQYKIELPSQPK